MKYEYERYLNKKDNNPSTDSEQENEEYDEIEI
jgi:hypothetical protein